MKLKCNCILNDFEELLQECKQHSEANFMKWVEPFIYSHLSFVTWNVVVQKEDLRRAIIYFHLTWIADNNVSWNLKLFWNTYRWFLRISLIQKFQIDCMPCDGFKCYVCDLTFKDETISEIHNDISKHSISKIKIISWNNNMVLSISPTQCKGFCKTMFHTTSFGGRFSTGLKKCSACYVSIMTEESRCPCCNLLLKTGPRNGKSKSNRFYERI